MQTPVVAHSHLTYLIALRLCDDRQEPMNILVGECDPFKAFFFEHLERRIVVVHAGRQDQVLDSEKDKLINRIVVSFILLWLAAKLALGLVYRFLAGHYQERRIAVAGSIHTAPPKSNS